MMVKFKTLQNQLGLDPISQRTFLITNDDSGCSGPTVAAYKAQLVCEFIR